LALELSFFFFFYEFLEILGGEISDKPILELVQYEGVFNIDIILNEFNYDV